MADQLSPNTNPQIPQNTWNLPPVSNQAAAWSVNQSPPNTIGQQVQQLNDQQQQIQDKYKQLKELYQNNELTVEQKQQIQQQMQKLSDLYTQNKQTLAMLATDISGDKQVQINKNIEVKEQRKGKKVSFGGIMIWCGIVFTFLVGWLAAIFYYLIQNPSQLSSVGIDPATATQLLQLFAIIFFGLLLFASLGMLIVNFYRLTTAKNKNKIPYILWIILWFVILIATIVFGSKTLNALKTIDVNSYVDSQALILPHWQQIASLNTANKSEILYELRNKNYPLIAPANIGYRLNTNLFNKQILPMLWDIDIKSISLDCWNGDILQINTDTAQSNWACMYESKWNYPLKLVINYVNRQTSEQLSKDIIVWDLPIKSQISVSTNQLIPLFSRNELILGKNPVKVTYDASEVYRDFQLSEYQIVWDADWDWSADKSDFTIYTHLYTWAWVYYVRVKYPNLNDHIYVFPVRVEQSDVPVAYLNFTEVNKTEYSISAQFYGVWPDISEYIFNILDKQTNKIIDTINSKTASISYKFPGNWVYAVQMIFVTQEWKQGSSESDNIEVGWSQFQIFYDVSIKTPTKPSFEKMNTLWDIQISEIPTILKIDVTNIIPSIVTAKIQVFVDGSPIVSTNNTFQITIDESKDYNIKIVVNDANRKITTEKEFKVLVKRDDIIWKLLISPDSVGTSPFSVKFDASTTSINDPHDQIVYFSWDFGDGDLKPNLSQSIINHTYNYDFENENGVFYPKVTVKTKKGRELVVDSGIMISVKKPIVTIDINLDSHPAQIANVWEKIDMSLSTSGLPDTIIRDFGNWNNLECKGRECTESSQIYNKPGDYVISVAVSYPDKPTIEWKINLVVR